jgi:hypothetical protein
MARAERIRSHHLSIERRVEITAQSWQAVLSAAAARPRWIVGRETRDPGARRRARRAFLLSGPALRAPAASPQPPRRGSAAPGARRPPWPAPT